MYNIPEQRDFEVDNFGSTERDGPFESNQLLVMSNRQPYRHEWADDGDITVDRPTGGLTAGLDPMMQRADGTWVAWGDGEADEAAVDEDDRVTVPPDDPSYALRRVWLSEEQVDDYYCGFSNRVLWPLCHSSLSTVRSKQSYWERYRETNEQFAATVSEEATERPVVWLQDYHFGLAPSYIRNELGERVLLMHFWHIPWPSWDVFRACPHGNELLHGLLGNDAIGFHTDRYCHNFLECVDASIDDVAINWRTGTISYRGRKVRAKSIPMGVPVEDIEEQATSYSESEFAEFRQSQGIDDDVAIAVGVDRLDYSKGIPERLRALERFWEQYPEWRGSLTHLLNGTESRSQIAAYQRLQERVDERIAQVNERFGTDIWQPVVEVDEYLSQRELYGLYRHADLCLVTPIRDGLNLIAQEYAAAQVEEDGVLVLSNQAGVHDIVGEAAVSVSPYDPGQFAHGLNEALTMPAQQREMRMAQIRQHVGENSLDSWVAKNATLAQSLRTEAEVSSTP